MSVETATEVPAEPDTGTVLVLRTCTADLTSHEGFQWPESGPVEAPDWDPEPRCGGGLHGLAWGEGHGTLLDWSPDARWLVVEVPAESLVDLGGKVKFPAGTVIHAGERLGAVAMIQAHPGAAGRAVVRGTATAGDSGTATAGEEGILVIHWYDANRHLYRVRVAEVDGEHILPGVAYRLHPETHEFERVPT